MTNPTKEKEDKASEVIPPANVCSSCGEPVFVEDIVECDICGDIFCPECADEEVVGQPTAPDDFMNMCRKCQDDKYENRL